MKKNTYRGSWCHCKKNKTKSVVAGPQRVRCGGGRRVIWMRKEAPKLVPAYQRRMKFAPTLLLFTSDLEVLLSVCVCVWACTVPAALTLCKPLGRFFISSLVLSILPPLQGETKGHDQRDYENMKSQISSLTRRCPKIRPS